MALLPPVPTTSDEVLSYMKFIVNLLNRGKEYKTLVSYLYVDDQSQRISIDRCGLRSNKDYTGMEFFIVGMVGSRDTPVSQVGQISDIVIVPASNIDDCVNIVAKDQLMITILANHLLT